MIGINGVIEFIKGSPGGFAKGSVHTAVENQVFKDTSLLGLACQPTSCSYLTVDALQRQGRYEASGT